MSRQKLTAESSLEAKSFWAPNLVKGFPTPKHGREQSDERQKGYFARLPDVPYNRLQMLPHLGPELPSPLESFFSKSWEKVTSPKEL